LESVVGNLGPDPHEEVLEHGLPIDLLGHVFLDRSLFIVVQPLELQTVVVLFVVGEWRDLPDLEHPLVQLPLSPFNLIDGGGIDEELGGVLVAVHGIEGLDQESEEEVHGVVVLDDKVDAPALDLEGDALPGEEWEGAFTGGLVVHLYVVVFHGNHVLSEDPES